MKPRARRIAEELLTQRDLTVAAAIIDADCMHHARVPVAVGRPGLVGWVTALRRAFPDMSAIVEYEIAEGDRVTHRLTVSGTQVALFCRLNAIGAGVAWRVLAIVRAGQDSPGRPLVVLVSARPRLLTPTAVTSIGRMPKSNGQFERTARCCARRSNVRQRLLRADAELIHKALEIPT